MLVGAQLRGGECPQRLLKRRVKMSITIVKHEYYYFETNQPLYARQIKDPKLLYMLKSIFSVTRY